MPHEHFPRPGQPIVIYNPGATLVDVFPGALIAPADATRRLLVIQSAGMIWFTVYARSGSDPANGAGINLFPVSGSVTMTDEDDPDMVIAEWWAYSASTTPALLSVTEEIFR